tara:strand:+ start:31 stop:612 length:582 start_codon:yes stop_codon:yes gene_type:complete
MFMGPYEDGGDWNDKGITGIQRFLNRFHHVCTLPDGDEVEENTRYTHKTIKSVSEDIEHLKFNTAISRMMECVNNLYSSNTLSKSNKSIIIRLLSPFAPHISEELWESIGKKNTVFNESWPEHNPDYLIENTMTIAVQVNGKLRGSIEMPTDSPKDEIITKIKEIENVKAHISDKGIIKEIYVPNKLVNLVVK